MNVTRRLLLRPWIIVKELLWTEGTGSTREVGASVVTSVPPDSQVSDNSKFSLLKIRRFMPQDRAACRIASERFSTSAYRTMRGTEKDQVGDRCRHPLTVHLPIKTRPTFGTGSSSDDPMVGVCDKIFSQSSWIWTNRAASFSRQSFSSPKIRSCLSKSCWTCMATVARMLSRSFLLRAYTNKIPNYIIKSGCIYNCSYIKLMVDHTN